MIDNNKGSDNLPKDHQKTVNNKILDEHSGIKNHKVFFKLAVYANIAAQKKINRKIKLPWENGSLKLVRKSDEYKSLADKKKRIEDIGSFSQRGETRQHSSSGLS